MTPGLLMKGGRLFGGCCWRKGGSEAGHMRGLMQRGGGLGAGGAERERWALIASSARLASRGAAYV